MLCDINHIYYHYSLLADDELNIFYICYILLTVVCYTYILINLLRSQRRSHVLTPPFLVGPRFTNNAIFIIDSLRQMFNRCFVFHWSWNRLRKSGFTRCRQQQWGGENAILHSRRTLQTNDYFRVQSTHEDCLNSSIIQTLSDFDD